MLEIAVGEPTFLSATTYQNSASVAVSRTGITAAFYPKPDAGPVSFFRTSPDAGGTWGPEMDLPPGKALRMSTGLQDGGVLFMSGQAAPDEQAPSPVLRAARTLFSDDFLTYQVGTSAVSMPQAALNTRWATFWPVFDKGKIVQLPDGHLLATLYGNFRGDVQYRTMLVGSTDQGLTWHFHATVAYSQDDPHPRLVGSYSGYCEPSLALLANGQLLCAMRTQGAQFAGEYRPLYLSWSDDLGSTWSTPAPTNPHLMNISPTLAVLHNGVVVCQSGRPGFHVTFSEDQGRTWQDQIRFTDLPEPVITGQFDIVRAGPNSLVAIGSDGEGTKVWPISVERVKAPAAQVALEGRVLDSQGIPVAGALVERSPRRYYLDAWQEHETDLDPWEETPLTVGSPVLGYRSTDRLKGHPAVCTDDDGRFRFGAVPAGETVLTVEAEGYAPVHRLIKVEPRAQAHEFRLLAGKKVCGQVVDDTGQPVPAACVVLNGWHVHTDEGGCFHWSVEAPVPEQVEIRVYRRYSDDYESLEAAMPLAQISEMPVVLGRAQRAAAP
jgi:hypothetical protein